MIIETGTDYTAYWGEFLAERIGAKHFVMLLDEKNSRIDENRIDFFKFKYDRKELACISPEAMKILFDENNIKISEYYYLSVYCANSIEDYDSKITDMIPDADYKIATIGRLDKKFVPSIIDGVIEFAEKHGDKHIALCMFGGAKQHILDGIKKRLDGVNNISCYISGYIFPIPLKAIKKCDVFVSGAASAGASARNGMPTVRMDVFNSTPKGLITDAANNIITPLRSTVSEYLEQLLVDKNIPEIIPFSNENEQKK